MDGFVCAEERRRDLRRRRLKDSQSGVRLVGVPLGCNLELTTRIAATRETYAGPLEVGEDLMSFEIGETVTVRWLRG